MAPLRTSFEKAPPSVLRVAGVAISHPERHIEVAPGHTKLDVVRYHESMAAWLLPQLSPRPITVVKFDEARFQERRHTHGHREEDDEVSRTFVRVSDIADVVRVVQNGSCEFQTWGASFPRLERPDRITLDLGADPVSPWRLLQDAAHQVRVLLDALGLGAFVKTTGGRGLHIVVPITRRHSWSEVRLFARAIADQLERRNPTLFTTNDAERRARVHVDYARNGDGATAVAAYSLRARPGLPVSMPVAWSEIESTDARRPHFDIDNALPAVARREADPWAGYDRSRQTLSGAMRRVVGV